MRRLRVLEARLPSVNGVDFQSNWSYCHIMASLKENFDYYLANQDELVERYNGKYVVIKDCQVIGVYVNQGPAVRETQKQHELGTFLVQLVRPGDQAYTQTFHSRVAFHN
jgi:hypothetical protein